MTISSARLFTAFDEENPPFQFMYCRKQLALLLYIFVVEFRASSYFCPADMGVSLVCATY